MRPLGLGKIKDVHTGTEDYPQNHTWLRNLMRVQKDN